MRNIANEQSTSRPTAPKPHKRKAISMRCVSLLAGLAAVFPLLAGASAFAHTSSDWGDVEAEIKALPPGFGDGAIGHIPQEVLDEVRNKFPEPANGPQNWTFVFGFDIPSEQVWSRRSDGLLWKSYYEPGPSKVFDPFGLMPLNSTDNLTVSGPIGLAGATADITIVRRDLGFAPLAEYNDWASIITWTDHITVGPDALDRTAVGTERHFFKNYSGYPGEDIHGEEEGETTSGGQAVFSFRRDLGMWISDNEAGSLLDWKIENGSWHSQALSKALSKTQKEQARALFARGFDLYKSGDLTGARALIESGLKIDSGNHLGWFTLAQIGRSTVAQNPDDLWGKAAERVYYQHTIDLAPDSPEAALAKGYLDALR